MSKFRKFIFIGFLLSGYCSFAQTIATINKFDTLHQHCLDKGEYMLGCAQLYYYQMDSMLNVVYKELRAKYDTKERGKLKNEELEWITDRDKYFKKVWNQNNGLGEGLDSIMVNVDTEAEFVRLRLVELANRLDK